MQKWFALMDVSNFQKYIHCNNEDSRPFTNVEDPRLEWLETVFLNYIEDLKITSKICPGRQSPRAHRAGGQGDLYSLCVALAAARVQGAFGKALFKEGGAARAASPVGSAGGCLGTPSFVRGFAENRSGADPPCTTSANDFCRKVCDARCRASLKLTLP